MLPLKRLSCAGLPAHVAHAVSCEVGGCNVRGSGLDSFVEGADACCEERERKPYGGPRAPT